MFSTVEYPPLFDQNLGISTNLLPPPSADWPSPARWPRILRIRAPYGHPEGRNPNPVSGGFTLPVRPPRSVPSPAGRPAGGRRGGGVALRRPGPLHRVPLPGRGPGRRGLPAGPGLRGAPLPQPAGGARGARDSCPGHAFPCQGKMCSAFFFKQVLHFSNFS